MPFPVTLSSIAAVLGAHCVGDAVVSGVSTDSRSVREGSLFVAFRGERHDAHDHLAEAMARGATALMVSNASRVPAGAPFVLVPDTVAGYGAIARWIRSEFAGPVVGITGSVGKTTTKEMTASVLSSAFMVHSTPGNFNNEIGLPTTILGAAENAGLLVLEMGMRGLGQIKQLCEIAMPTIGIVTGIGVSHIELLGSREAIADAKSELFEALPGTGVAIYPAFDAMVDRLRSGCSHCRSLSCGIDCPADVVATNLVSNGVEWHADVRSPWGAAHLRVPSPARFNVVNALFAIAAGGACGVDPQTAAAALAGFEAPAGRLKTIPLANGGSCIDDAYNAAPDSMEGALDVLAGSGVATGGKRVAVLGEMKELGAYSSAGHAQVGRAVARTCPDMLVLVGDATRSIESAARVDGYPADRIHWFATSAETASLLPVVLDGRDTVLVKGSRGVGLDLVVTAIVSRLGIAR